jgi:cyclic pyranopterin phosphate synthase
MSTQLSHIDSSGKARMVDVGLKPDSKRIAIAKGEVVMQMATHDVILAGNLKKGDVLTVAQLAGIMAAKRTAELIPLCHPITLNNVKVELETDRELPGIKITATVEAFSKTGVEMEALTAVAVAALTVYDMAKSVEKTMHIQNLRLVEKHGGQSGDVLNE